MSVTFWSMYFPIYYYYLISVYIRIHFLIMAIQISLESKFHKEFGQDC